MLRMALLPAVLTGVFCAGFAMAVELVTEALNVMTLIALAFVSGFLGSLFARLMLRDTPAPVEAQRGAKP